MKLTKETLKRIIKEELDKVMNEEELDEGLFDFFKGKKKEEPQQEPQQEPQFNNPEPVSQEPEPTAQPQGSFYDNQTLDDLYAMQDGEKALENGKTINEMQQELEAARKQYQITLPAEIKKLNKMRGSSEEGGGYTSTGRGTRTLNVQNYRKLSNQIERKVKQIEAQKELSYSLTREIKTALSQLRQAVEKKGG